MAREMPEAKAAEGQPHSTTLARITKLPCLRSFWSAPVLLALLLSTSAARENSPERSNGQGDARIRSGRRTAALQDAGALHPPLMPEESRPRLRGVSEEKRITRAIPWRPRFVQTCGKGAPRRQRPGCRLFSVGCHHLPFTSGNGFLQLV